MLGRFGVCCAALFLCVQARANLVLNGSFEDVFCNASFCSSGGGTDTTMLPGWSIHEIDVVSSSLWAAQDGLQSLDLSGLSAGDVSQTFATLPGSSYNVGFYMAGNFGSGPTIKHLTVLADGQSQDYTFDVTGKSGTNMGWTFHTFTFLADDTQATLKFQSNDFTNAGPALDNVDVEIGATADAPEPAAFLLTAAGFAILAFRVGQASRRLH